MALVDIVNIQGEKISETDLPDSIFNVPVKPELLHEVVTMQLACRRAGTASVKRRSEVAGSSKKLFRQKGTGRARRGNIRSPLLRGGGVVFGPKPKSFAYSMPKKKRNLAMRMALSSKFQANELVILNEMPLDQIKTKKFVKIMNALDRNNSLIILDEENRNIELSARNVPESKVLRSQGLNVYDILKFKHLVLLESAINSVTGRFA